VKVTSTGDALVVADRTGGDPHEIVPIEPNVHNHNPVWSTDSQWIYFARGVSPTDMMDTMDVWRVRPTGGAPERVTHENRAMSYLAPLDAHTLLYVGRSEDLSGPWLWAVDLDRKNARPRRVTIGVEQYTSVAATRDGSRIVATVANPTSSLWRVPLRDGGVDEHDAEPYAVPADHASGPRFGGGALFYSASSSGSAGLWRLRDGQPLPIRTGSAGAMVDAAAVTRDGTRVAMISLRGAERHLTVMSSDGTGSRTIATSLKTHGSVDWSPDGQWIVTGAVGAQGMGLYKVPLGGGDPVPLVRGLAFDPVWSPDGSLIVYVSEMAGSVLLRAVRPDTTLVELPRVSVGPGRYRFLPDGRRLVYMEHLQSSDFSLLDLDTRTVRPLTRLANRGELRGFDVTPDGQFLVFDRLRANANVVLIELPKHP
jgi:Tol biopolymer transport system component